MYSEVEHLQLFCCGNSFYFSILFAGERGEGEELGGIGRGKLGGEEGGVGGDGSSCWGRGTGGGWGRG